MRQIIAPLVCGLTLAACSPPQSYFETFIESKNFIPFKLPMSSTRVGTILRGNNSEIYLVARPETCFPDLLPPLRWVQETDLPSQYSDLQLEFNSNLNSVLNLGNSQVQLNGSAKFVKTVELQFSGATIEYLDESAFFQHMENHVSEQCRSLIHQYPFIGQALRIESMRFVFRDERGASIDLEARLDEIVDISAEARWSLENRYTLLIESPKFIGYRMAKLKEGILLYASKTDKNDQWIFENPDQHLLNGLFQKESWKAEPLLKP